MGGGAALRSAAARGAGLLRALGGRCVVKPCADSDDVAPDGAAAGAGAADAQEDALTDELFNKLLEHSPDMFFFGNGNVCEHESPSIPRILGHSLVGPVMMANVHPEDREALAAATARCTAESVATGQPVSASVTMRFLPRDSRPLLWVDNKVTFSGVRWYCCLLDVSAAKLAERSLHDWLATTSHDARTPLSSIQVSCVLLRERGPLSHDGCGAPCHGAKVPPEEACDGELLTAISASASVLLAIVKNVMLLKRLDAGECDLSASTVAPRALVADVCATASVGLALQAGASIVLDDDSQLPPAIVCAVDLVSHVLLCLVVFCVCASRGGEVRVRARCSKSSSAQRTGPLMLRLDVCAPTLLMTQQELDCAFAAPYDSDCMQAELHGGESGSGRMGLHVSCRLVEAMGGTLSLRSRSGLGTCFKVLIPVALPEPSADAAPPSPAASASGSETAVCSRRASEDSSSGPPGSPRERVSPAASVTAEEEEDLGIAPYLPVQAESSGESFESLKRRGMLRDMMDLLLTNSPDGYTVGKGSHFIYASPGALRLFHAAKDQLLSTPVTELMHPEDRPRILEEWDEAREYSAARGGEPVHRSYTWRARHCDSDPAAPSYVWMAASAVIIQSPEPGAPGQWFNILRNIGDQKRLESSLKHFLHSTMADMLQPLTGIQAASTLLSQRPSVQCDEDASFLVAAISSASKLLGGIVANVLSLRALESGTVAVRSAPFSLRRLVSSVVAVCRMCPAHTTAARVTWLEEEEAALPPVLLGDEDRLAQILLNLVTNACKFADGSDVTVSTRVQPADAAATGGAATLRLIVADGGRGMSAEECARAFEPYYRAPSHRGGGTGLGLYICKRFSQALGGSLTLQSAPGRGARFELAVPASVAPAGGDAEAAAPSTAPSQPAQAAEPATPTTPTASAAQPQAPTTPEHSAACSPPCALRRLRVLLVEDHPLNARLCKRLLETRGHADVTLADDGDAALQLLIASYEPLASPFDLCLMDMSMPVMDGLQATKQFRAFERRSRPGGERLPVIALSANVFDEAIEDCRAAGMDGFVPKPLRIDMLRATLASTNIVI